MCQFLEAGAGRSCDYSLLTALGETFFFAVTAITGHVHIVLQLFAFSVGTLSFFHCACILQLHFGMADTPFYFAWSHGPPENLKIDAYGLLSSWASPP